MCTIRVGQETPWRTSNFVANSKSWPTPANTPVTGCLSNQNSQSKLEEKLDNITDILRTQKPSNVQDDRSSRCPSAGISGNDDSQSTWATRHEDSTSRSCPPDSLCPEKAYAPSSPREVLSGVYDPAITGYRPLVPTQEPMVLSSQFEPSPSQALEQLSLFRSEMLISFPFTHISGDVTPHYLRTNYPFFWFNILTVTNQRRQQQLAMALHMKQYLAQSMVVESEKSLDLLYGLVVFLGW